MLTIYKDALNILIIPSLKTLEVLINPFIVFNFKDSYNRKVCFSLTDDSSVSTYSRFSYLDGSIHSLAASGSVDIYESVVDASAIDTTMTFLKTELYKFIDPALDIFSVVDPLIYQDGSIFAIINPYLFMDCSGNTQNIVSKIYVDGSLALRDASITDLYSKVGEGGGVSQEYVDGSLASKVNIASLDSSLSNYMLNTGDTVTGDYTFDASTLFIDSVNHRIGIGTTAPIARLEIRSITTLSGTSSINGTTSVTGSGTSYIKEVMVGESVTINGETRVVNVVITATSFGVSVAFTSTASAQTVTITNASNTFFSGGYSTFSSANGVITEINTNNGGSYGIRSSSVIKGNGFYMFGATGGLYASGGVPLFYQAAGNLFGMGATNTVSKLDVIQPTIGVGTVSNTAGGTTVTGVGTVFTDTFKIGDTITATGGTPETRTISAIASNTSMTTNAWTNAHTTSAYTLVGGTRFSVKGNGNVGIKTTTPQYTLDVSGNFHAAGAATIDGSIMLNNQSISGLLTPVNSSDATNKYYVDTALGDIGTALATILGT